MRRGFLLYPFIVSLLIMNIPRMRHQFIRGIPLVFYILLVQYDSFNDRSLMTVWDEGKGWNRSCYDQVGFFADCDRSQYVTNSHCICRIDRAGIERLFRCKSHPNAAESHYEPHVSARTRARIVIRSKSHRKTSFNIILGSSVWKSEEE